MAGILRWFRGEGDEPVDCKTQCLKYGEFVHAFQLSQLDAKLQKDLSVARETALNDLRQQEGVRTARERFHVDPRVQAMDAAARERAKASFESQLQAQLEKALGPWESDQAKELKQRRDANMGKVYEARATQMAKCHQACEAWQGEDKMKCLRREIRNGNPDGAESCFL